MGQHRRKVTGLVKFVLPGKCDPVLKVHGLTGGCRACLCSGICHHTPLSVCHGRKCPWKWTFPSLWPPAGCAATSTGQWWEQPQSASAIEVNVNEAVDFKKKSGLDPKPLALKAVGIKKNTDILWGEGGVKRAFWVNFRFVFETTAGWEHSFVEKLYLN